MRPDLGDGALMRFAVEPWAPEYGAPVGGLDAAEPSPVRIDAEVERPERQWAPIAVTAAPAPSVGFVDGVRRVDAEIWITSAAGRPLGGAGGYTASADGVPRLGLCASYAAGVVRCTGAPARGGQGLARVDRLEVRRELLCPLPGLEPILTRHGAYRPRISAGESAEQLGVALQGRMRALEIEVTARAPAVDLLILDGPLSGRHDVRGQGLRGHGLRVAVGVVKTHHASYLPPALSGVIARLAPRQRTPVFAVTTSWSRFSWYLRLPGPRGHPWAGIVRAEAGAEASVAETLQVADEVTATLPVYASAAHKDPRAPQNLYPIGGLERVLRRRLGDGALLYRCLQAAARSGNPADAACVS